jgi:phosphoserine phosphatase RsbU/P
MIDSDNIRVKRNLTALVEFSRIINSSLDLEFILNNVLLTCMGKFLATKGMIALNINKKIVLKTSKGIPDEMIKKFPEAEARTDFKENTELINFFNECKLSIYQRISSSEDCLGIVCLGEKLNKSPFSDDDVEFLRTILNISASAIQNSMVINELKKVNRVLDSRIQRLNSLFELSKEFGLFSETTRIARLLVYSVIGQFLVSKFAVVIFNNGNVNILESKYPESDLVDLIKEYDFSKLDNSVVKENISKDYPRFTALQVELIVPMQLQGETKGLIFLGKRINNQNFSEADVEFIYSIGSLAIISLENRRLFKEELAKQKMEEELELARGIQRNLLPSEVPFYKSFDISAFNLASQQVGGDYYDIITLDEDTFCIAIGDVSGKGVPAALLMANLQAFLKTTCKQGMHLEEATALVNDLISENTSDGKFITFFWAVFEEQKKQMQYVNAGHNHPLLIRNGKIRKLGKGGIILGVMKTVNPYESEIIHLQKDDIIVLFTDGITEAMNKQGEEFSDRRLEELVLSIDGKPSQEILDSIKKEVQSFAAGTVQSDDMTIIVIKIN